MTVNLTLFFFQLGMVYLPGRKRGALWVPWAQAQHPWPANPTQEPQNEKAQTPTGPGMSGRPSTRIPQGDKAQTLAGPCPWMPGRLSARALEDPIARTPYLAQALILLSGNSLKQSCQPTLHFTSVSSLMN